MVVKRQNILYYLAIVRGYYYYVKYNVWLHFRYKIIYLLSTCGMFERTGNGCASVLNTH